MIPPVPPYTISGAEGASLGPERLTLETLNATDAVLNLVSMGADTVTFYQRLRADGTPPIPDEGQAITLWDDTGTRLFTGTVERESDWQEGTQGYFVTASNAVKFMAETTLTSLIADGAGTPAERARMIFPTGDLRDSLIALIERLRTLGLQLQIGEISTCFEVTRMTFNKANGDDALLDMLKWIPDAGTRVRYEEGGLPKLDIIRRDAAELIVLELGTDPDRTLKVSLKPEPHLRAGSVTVNTASRDAQKRVIFGSETAGDPATPANKRQLVTTAGEENTGTTLADRFENATLQTGLANWAWVKTEDADVVQAIEEEGDFDLVAAENQAYSLDSTANGNYNIVYSYTATAPALYDTATGAALPAGWYRLITATVPDWVLAENNLTVKDAYLEGHFAGFYAAPEERPDGVQALSGTGRVRALSGYNDANVLSDYRFYKVKVPVKVINANLAVAATYYREQDLDFIFTPAGLAGNVFKAQDFLGYRGTVEIGRGAPALPRPGDTLSIRGSREPGWETMRAMVGSLELTLATGTAVVGVGTPGRAAPATLLDRHRRAAADTYEANS